MKSYVLTNTRSNRDRARVDDLVLLKGGDPVELTDEQAKRLRGAGAGLREHGTLDGLTKAQLLELPDAEQVEGAKSLNVEPLREEIRALRATPDHHSQ